MSGAPTFLDLFCGCGGFTLGMERADFQYLAAIDFNPEAIKVFRANFGHIPEELILERDLTNFPPEKLAALIETDRVDVIVGGPPCQGFSTARQRDGAMVRITATGVSSKTRGGCSIANSSAMSRIFNRGCS